MKIYKEEERIDTQIQRINFKGYLLLHTLVLCVLLIKITSIKISMISIITELVILIGGNLYILIRSLLLKVNLIDFLKGRDEFNLIYRNKFFSQGFYLSFILIGMMTILSLLLGRIDLCYFIAIEFFIPGIYVMYKNIKEGLLVLRIKESKKNFRVRFILILGIIFLCTLGKNWEVLKSHKSLTIKAGSILFDLLADILLIIIPTHFALKGLFEKSQKNADKLNN